MARLGRYFLSDQPLHVIQCGANRQAIFLDGGSTARYRTILAEAADACGCAIHACVPMTNHVREVCSDPVSLAPVSFIRPVKFLCPKVSALF